MLRPAECRLFLKRRWEHGAYRVGGSGGGGGGEEEEENRWRIPVLLCFRVKEALCLLSNKKKGGLGNLYTVRIFLFFAYCLFE